MKDISKMTLEELKSLGFDQIQDLTRIQQNLQLINNEIAKRQENPKVEEGKVEKK